MSIVTSCDHCGILDACSRIFDQEERLNLDLCEDCERDYFLELEAEHRQLYGDDDIQPGHMPN